VRGNEWTYIKDCLDTGWVSSVGPYVDRFERELADRVGTQYAVATTSGTAALHTALLVAGVEADDEVLISALTFIAPANAIRYIGAWPVFIDSEPTYWQMDPKQVLHFVEQGCRWDGSVLWNQSTGRRVRAVVPVHILGHPVDMDPILEVARKYNLVVVEDATESLGAKYKGQNVGHLGDIACFSFNGNKIMTTGGGGMIVTDRKDWAERAKYLTTQAKDDVVEFVHKEIGYNYRLTNIQAAMGCAQLEVLDDYISAKRQIAGRYTEVFQNISGLKPLQEAPWAFSIYWMYAAQVEEGQLGLGSRALLRHLEVQNIQTRPLWQPLHLSPAYAGLNPQNCPVATQLYEKVLSLPCSVGLIEEDQARVIAEIISISKMLS